MLRSSDCLVDSCTIDSVGNAAIYINECTRCVVRANIITNVVILTDGISTAGGDNCAIGVQGSGGTLDTLHGWNTVEYNNMTNIYNAFVDFFWCNGDTIRYNTGVGARSGIPAHGTGLYIAYNDFTGMPNVQGGGFNAGGSYNTSWRPVTFIGNALRGVTDYGLHVNGVNHGEAFIFTGNTVSGKCNTYFEYQTAYSNIASTGNTFCGSGNFIYHGTTYHSLAAFQSATGYERGSVWNSSLGSPTGMLTATPQALPGDGDTVTLRWTSQNAISASISPNIGAVALNGSKNVYVTSETQFILTLSNGTTTVQYPVIIGNSTTSVHSGSTRPTKIELEQNYPNPFNPSTVINYQLSVAGKVRLSVYDMLGREIATLVDGEKKAGNYSETFDGSRLSSGAYFTRFIVNPENGKQIVQVKKILLAK
jgi:hypothetical protein